jgi:ParB family chromosome partitioning protein
MAAPTRPVEAQLLNALLRIPIDLVEPGPNVRAHLDGIDELATSIRHLGMQKPLLVTEVGGGRYRILDGHRRHAAARRLGLAHVDAILRKAAPDVVRIQQQLSIQAQTEAFDPIAESVALNSLMWDHRLTREEIAAAVGRTPAWVRDRIALTHLTDSEKRDVAAGRMTVASALATLRGRRAARSGNPDRPLTGSFAARAEGRHCVTCTCAPKKQGGQ